MNFTAQDVKELREKTGCGMMDCKKALSETNGDMEKAIDFLREKGLATAAKKSGRIASEGIVKAYLTDDKKIGVLVEAEGSLADEAAYEAARDAAMQIAAINPLYLSQETVPQEDIEKEKGILMAQIKEDPKNASKPDAIIEKMMGGKINKFFEQNCLLQQEFVKDSDQKVGKYLESKGVKLINFVRFEKGEGLEKKEENFADEVASMMK